VEKPLDYVVYGLSATTDYGQWELLKRTEALTPQQGKLYQQQVPVMPFADGSASFAIMRIDTESFVAAFAQPEAVRYLRVPTHEMRALRGDLAPLLAAAQAPLDKPLLLAPPQEWPANARRKAIAAALALVGDEMEHLLLMLAGAMTPDGLMIAGNDGGFAQRLALMQGLTLLIPEPFRYYLTFSLNAATAPAHRPRIVFCNDDPATSRKRLNWHTWSLNLPASSGGMRYVEHLRALWKGDLDDWLRHLHTLDQVAASMAASDNGLSASMDEVAGRALFDRSIDEPESGMTSAQVLDILTGDLPLEPATRTHYTDRLLTLALEERDSAASAWLAARMDEDSELNRRFSDRLDSLDESQPDAVYAFVRAHLNNGGDPERWLPRLHHSARSALNIALESADPPTIASWLQLLAREPERYGLGEILREGILGALPLAYEDAALARDLLIRAVKREPTLLLPLLADQRFVNALTDDVQRAVIDHEPRAIEAQAATSRELFLLSLARAADTRQPLITARMAVLLWELYLSRASFIVAEPFQPLTLIHRMVGPDRVALQEGVMVTLLYAMLEQREDELYFESAAALAADEAFLPTLFPVLRDSTRDVDDIINLVTTLTSQGVVNAQTAVNLYVSLLDHHHWDEKTMLPMMEQLGRMMSQPAEIRVPTPALWHLIEANAAARNEILCKGALKRLLYVTLQNETEEELVKDLVRLRRATQNMPAARLQMQNWWRDYTNNLALPQLQKLEKALEGQRTLDDLRVSLTTYINTRRQFAGKTLEEWAQDISTAFRVLKALSDGYDPENRSVGIDVATIQRVIDQAVNTWQSDERHVLAANLKDLAELLASMADARTKPSLIRNDEALERQLMSGEHAPQSAIDVMKWLAGYLDSSQKNGI
jgi:hypothetical protein